MFVKDIIRICEKLAPEDMAVEGDNIGLIIGSAGDQVKGVLVALDVTHRAIDHALKKDCNVMVVHHPPIYAPIRKVDYSGAQGGLIKRIIESGISIYAMHTNLDSAPKGLNHETAKLLGLKNIRNVNFHGIAYRLGILPEKTDAKGLAIRVKKALKLKSVRYYGDCGEIEKVAVCTGSGADFLADAASRGAHALVTGEVRHHNALECEPLGTTLIEAGHFGTERPMIQLVARHLKNTVAKSKKDTKITRFDDNEPYESI